MIKDVSSWVDLSLEFSCRKLYSVLFRDANEKELRKLLDRVIQRVVSRLESDGLLIPDPVQPWLDLDFHDPIDSLSAASIRIPYRNKLMVSG